jgi:hypothetical protein
MSVVIQLPYTVSCPGVRCHEDGRAKSGRHLGFRTVAAASISCGSSEAFADSMTT